MIRIAFGSKARTGKDTSADYVCKRFGVKKQQFSKPVYDIMHLIQDYFGKEHCKDPEVLQLIGEGLRNTTTYTKDVWANVVMDKLGNNPAAISDLRYPNEYAKLKASGFVTVRTQRANRIIDRDPNNPSETSLDNQQFDEVINNDYSKIALYARINYILEVNKQCTFIDYVMLSIRVDGKCETYIVDPLTFTCAGISLDDTSAQSMTKKFIEEFGSNAEIEIVSVDNQASH